MSHLLYNDSFSFLQLATGKEFSYDLVESLEQYYHSRRSLGLSVDKTIREFCSDSTFEVRKLILRILFSTLFRITCPEIPIDLFSLYVLFSQYRSCDNNLRNCLFLNFVLLTCLSTHNLVANLKLNF